MMALLGIELPVIQAPMAGVQDAQLAAAVCNAGGLGSLPCAMLSTDGLHSELRKLCTATDRPFNTNFFCHQTPAVSAQQTQVWLERLSTYFEELGLELPSLATPVSRAPFSTASLDILEQFKPAVVSFHFGLPERAQLRHIQGWGAKVLGCATTVREARWLEQRGVDAIIAQGVEAGGHRGNFLSEDMTTQSGTMALVPSIRAAVSVPVIAAGGIASAAGMTAALALGADAAQIGTAFLLCSEAKTSNLHRAALSSEAAQHTALTNVFTGRAARSIVNRLIREVGPMAECATAFPTAAGPVALLRSAAEALGKHDFTPLWCGQNALGCAEIPASEMLYRLTSEL
ncbi:MAG: nitronate monooxygenase [Halioglobus sp.]